MSEKNTIPEVASAVDEEQRAVRGAQGKKSRSKKGHERRVNAALYVILALMSIIWLAPFVFLVCQSFRSYLTEDGGMVAYLLPKQWSLDNYRFLLEDSDFFTWTGRALAAAGIAALVQSALLGAVKAAMGRLDSFRKGARALYVGFALLIGGALLICLTGVFHQVAMAQMLSEKWLSALIVLALYGAAGLILARLFLKQDDALLRSIPGYESEEKGQGLRKAAALFGEFLVLGLLLQCLLKPMTTNQFLTWYGNTLTIALFVAVLQTIIVLSVSYALSRLRFKGRKLIMNVVLVLGLFPGFLTMITLYFLLKQIGLTGPGAVPGLILIYVASSGMGYYISKGFFDTIPKSLDESARIDGATRFQVFLKIIMPLAKPIVIYTVLMAFMAPWGDFVFASYVAFKNPPTYNVAVGLYQWVNTTDYQGYFTRFCAGGVLVAVPITALFMALQKYYVEGVTGGAVKG